MKAVFLYNERELWRFFQDAIVLHPALYQKILSEAESYTSPSDKVFYYPLFRFSRGEFETTKLEFYKVKFIDGYSASEQWLCKTPIVVLPYDKVESYNKQINEN